jgi:preprotein translocase subunit SecB
MIAKRSDLILKKFVIVESRLSFILPEKDDKERPFDILNSYPVDIDFSVEQDMNKEIYRIVTSVNINANNEEDKPGYSITVTGMSFFEFDKATELTEEQKVQMLRISGLSICIANLRSYIANQTSYYPWGSFSFYAVDIQELLKSEGNFENKN